MAGRRTSRLALAALALCTAAVGATAATDTCCGVSDGSTCCPKPPIVDNADNLLLPEDRKLRVVYDPERCCSDDSVDSAAECAAYGVAGCSFCRNACDEDDGSCVECPVAHDRVSTTVVGESEDDDADSDDLSPMEGDFDASTRPGSYNFDDYDCSNCSWDGMSLLEQRLLTQRSRSMVCDKSCLYNSGDPNYGVTLCNYFDHGKECRACCHEGFMVDGCMPCEGKGSCDTCVTNINNICDKEHICDEDCHAHVCCSMQWAQYSGCQQTMSLEIAGLAERITNECPSHFVDCETINPECSDTARACTAKIPAVSRRVQEVAHKRCRLMSVAGAGGFDQKYTSAGAFGSELIFSAVGAEHFVLQSISLDACAGLDKLAFIDAASADIIVARSSSGSLAWDDGTEPHPYAMNAGVGCSRHVWFLRDTNGQQDHAFVTVDKSEHPQFISSDWVKVGADGKMARTDLTISCIKEKKEYVKF